MKLALYYYPGCPYCHRVLRVLRQLDVQVELRHIYQNREHLRDLVQARGRRTVPVLRIEDEQGVTWMPESLDIVDWLHDNYAARAGT